MLSNISKNIKFMRKVSGLTQSEFASEVGLTRPTVGAYEEGRAQPSIEKFIDICKHFGVDVVRFATTELTEQNYMEDEDKYREHFMKGYEEGMHDAFYK